MQRLTILKILLLFSAILIFKFELQKSKINENQTSFEGRIVKIAKTDYSTTIELKEKETIIIYIKEIVNYSVGDVVKVEGVLTKPDKNKVFNLFNYQNYLKSRKIYWILKAEKIELIDKGPTIIDKTRKVINSRIENLKSKEYIKSFILGAGDIDDNVMKSYQKNGIIHILSISGTHIALLVMFLKKPKYIIPMLIMYLLLTGFLISLTRAALFYILIQLKKYYDIKIKNKDILELMALTFLVINPYLIYSISFLFSFTITYFIIISNVNEDNKIVNMILISIVSFLASIPILLKNFFEINPLTPILNLIFIPIFSFLIFPLSLLTFLFPSLDNILYFSIEITEKLSNIAASLTPMIIMKPLNIALLVSYYIILLMVKKKKKQVLLIIAVLFVNSLSLSQVPRLTFIDVDQGDSILLEANKKVILIDTGGKYGSYKMAQDRIIPYIKSLGYSKIDFLILTHGDYDHAKDAIYILDNFKVEQTIINSGGNNSLEEEIIQKSKKIARVSKATIDIGDVKLKFINEKYDNENEDSLIIYTEINNKKVLLTGDATVKNEAKIINDYNIANIDILKIGHHGSITSTSSNFILRMKPKYSVIQVGTNNKFGHPKKEVLKRLEESTVFRTDINGSIRFILQDKIKIETTNMGGVK